MSLDYNLLASEIVNAIAPRDLDNNSREQMTTAWRKISKTIIEHIQRNAEVSVSARVITTNDPDTGAITDISITEEQTTIYDGNGDPAPATFSHLRGGIS